MTGTVRWTVTDTGVGPMLVAATDTGLASLVLGAERARSVFEAWVARHAPGARVVEDAAGLAGVTRQLVEYGAGERRAFELDLDLRGTAFQLEVWRGLLAIPWGRTRTYGELAAAIGRPGGSRAVGRAAGGNPVPVVVPCHRLLAKGGLGGFTGGRHHKERLLELEGVLFSGNGA